MMGQGVLGDLGVLLSLLCCCSFLYYWDFCINTGTSVLLVVGVVVAFCFRIMICHWFYRQKCVFSKKCCSNHWFYNFFKKKRCGSRTVVRATTVSEAQQLFVRKCCKTNGLSNILRRRGGAQERNTFHQPSLNAPEPLQSETCLGNQLRALQLGF